MLSEQMNCYKNKKDLLRAKLGTIPLIFDGGMGSQLNLKGLRPGEITDECNILHPEWVSDIQASYLEAGASCILTNTLGSNRFHLADSQFSLREIIEAAIRNGREAIDREETRCRRQGIDKSCFLIYDIGSLGQLMEPSGSLSFENAYEAFKEQILILGDQVDAILIETVSDIYEMKAAVLAAKENSDLPIFSSMTFGESGKTLMGTTPTAMVTFLEGIGVDCLGINCSLGPKEMEPIVEEILSVARIPVIVQPNAGLPVFSGNETVYNVSVEEFCEYIYKFVKAGVSVVGGCCGTTPEYIRGISNLLQNEKLARRVNSPRTCISSGSVSVTLGERIAICGERLNPTGRKLLRQAILEKRYDVLLLEAASQEQSGAHVLDVNVGVPGIDEPAVMAKVVKSLQEVIRLPLQIDSSNPEALEKACRIYNGKPLINSVNGKREVMEAVFPIVKKYGGVVLGLTLDESGIPPRAEDRLTIAKRIVETAATYGIDRSDVIIDCLVLTASAQQEEVAETLKALTLVKQELRVHTVLGCSNVSFGLPNRPLINKTFLAMAIYAGLDLAIINPLDVDLMATIDAAEVLLYKDIDSVSYIDRHASDQANSSAMAVSSPKGKTVLAPSDLSIRALVEAGMKQQVVAATREALKQRTALSIINQEIIPGLDAVGKAYESVKLFLPQLILSAETTKIAFATLRENIPTEDTQQGKGPIVIATVEGDIHDIGKNIVRVILESYGFLVIDLGKDVPAQAIVEAYQTYRPRLIGLSALMTTTIPFMEKTITALHEIGADCKIMVGGAVLSQDIAKSIQADFYAKDAMGAVEIAKSVIPDS